MKLASWLSIALLGSVACSDREEPVSPAAASSQDEVERYLAEQRGLMLPGGEPSAADRALLAEYAEIVAGFERARQEGTEDANALPAPPVDGALFGVETRDHRLWFLDGAGGRRYAVTDRRGTLLADGIGEAQLESEYPRLHELLHGGFDVIGIDY